jgi:hypothetical protein
MGTRQGSAIILAMVLLVLLSAAGMYAVSMPVPVGDAFRQQYLSAVARNMARAGAHAAIARLPDVFPDALPCIRRIPVGTGAMGRYAVTSRRIGKADGATGNGRGIAYEGYSLVSEGSVPGAFWGTFQVRAEVRFVRVPGERGKEPMGPETRARILKWEETGPR